MTASRKTPGAAIAKEIPDEQAAKRHARKKIASALVDQIPSIDLSTLISETQTAIEEANATADAERVKALDPTASPDPTAAREAMQAAEFARDRLHTVLPRLQKRLQEVQQDEEFERWLPRYEAAKERCHGLAMKLRELYLPFAAAVVPLFLDIEKADQEVRLVNHEAPYKAMNAGGYLLESVEHAARGPSALQLRHLQILKDLRLPDWEGAELPVWPPYRPINVAAFTPAVLRDPRLSTGDWWQVKKEQARAVAERAEREEKEQATEAAQKLTWS